MVILACIERMERVDNLAFNKASRLRRLRRKMAGKTRGLNANFLRYCLFYCLVYEAAKRNRVPALDLWFE